jgi:hypothetical protein
MVMKQTILLSSSSASRKREMRLFCYFITVLSLFLTFTEVFVIEVSAQVERNTETLIIPYTAFNAQGWGEERFESDHKKDWLLSIKNNLIYNPVSPESSIVLRLKEDAQSQEYIKLAMNGRNKISVIVNIKETGYLPISSNEDSWSPDKPLILLFSEADGGRISISNGERTLGDKLRVGKFSVGTIEFYGSSYPLNTQVVSDGHVKLDMTSGNSLASNSLVLLLIFAGFAAAVLLSVRGIKGSKDRWYGRRGW